MHRTHQPVIAFVRRQAQPEPEPAVIELTDAQAAELDEAVLHTIAGRIGEATVIGQTDVHLRLERRGLGLDVTAYRGRLGRGPGLARYRLQVTRETGRGAS